MKAFKLILTGLLICVLTPSLVGSVVIHVENKVDPFVQGTTGNKLSVYAYTTLTDNADRFLNGYLLGFDFVGPGKGIQSGFTNFSGNAAASFSSGFSFDASLPEFDNFDFLVQASETSSNLVNLKDHTSIATAVKLFDLQFDVTTSAPVNVYVGGFVVRPDATADGSAFSFLTINGGASSAFSASGGNFEVEAVPEPSSIALLGLGLVAGAGRLFRKRRNRNRV